ncbi:MAG: hypothetical protein K2M73_08055 [Lachnospiraceae bacterium]|nr:hypothetical protein [Lachnospiraceae bacterium]
METVEKKSVKIETLEYNGQPFAKKIVDFITDVVKKSAAQVILEHGLPWTFTINVWLVTDEGRDPIVTRYVLDDDFLKYYENNEEKWDEIRDIIDTKISENINGIKIPNYGSVFQFMTRISPYFNTISLSVSVDANEYTLEEGTDDNNK